MLHATFSAPADLKETHRETPNAAVTASIAAFQMQRGAEHLLALGTRATYEFLAEIGTANRCTPDILARLPRYRQLTPATLRGVGANRFPPRPLNAVPQ